MPSSHSLSDSILLLSCRPSVFGPSLAGTVEFGPMKSSFKGEMVPSATEYYLVNAVLLQNRPCLHQEQHLAIGGMSWRSK